MAAANPIAMNGGNSATNTLGNLFGITPPANLSGGRKRKSRGRKQRGGSSNPSDILNNIVRSFAAAKTPAQTGGRSRRLRRRSGHARRRSSKTYSAGGKRKQTRRK